MMRRRSGPGASQRAGPGEISVVALVITISGWLLADSYSRLSEIPRSGLTKDATYVGQIIAP
jgi:hypothetical protein